MRTITDRTITGGAHWTSGIYTIEASSLTITDGVLEVDPCTKIIMSVGGQISVDTNGALSLSGTQSGPILITSPKSAPQPGDWAYIEFNAVGDNGKNKLQYVTVEYGGSGYGAIWIQAGARVAITNSTVRQANHFGIQMQDGAHLSSFTGNTLTGNARGPIELGANSVDDLGVGTYSPNTIEGIQILREAVAHDATWLKLDAPYVAPNGFSVQVASGSAHLTISAGTLLKLGDSAVVSVSTNGGLNLAGTAAAPITVTSSKGAPAPGDWAYIELNGDSSQGFNKIDHAVIEYGGKGYGAVWVESAAYLHMKDSTIWKSADYGLQLQGGATLLDFTGNTLTQNAKGPVELGANTVDSLGAGTYSPNTIEGIQILREAVAHDATWLKLDAPYVAQEGFRVEVASGSAALTVNAGVTIKIGPDQVIGVGTHGALTLSGAADNRVTITSAVATPSAGDWAEIDINAGSQTAKNVFHYADISYGGSGTYGQLWVAENAGVTFDHVAFSHARVCDVSGGGTIQAGADSTYTVCP